MTPEGALMEMTWNAYDLLSQCGITIHYFTSQLQVNRSIQDLVALLRCSSYSLGIMASSRGIVVGRLMLQEPNQDVIDCSVLLPCGSSGFMPSLAAGFFFT